MIRITNKMAFTLLEIMIVVIIIGILGGMVLQRYNTTVERTTAQEGVQTLSVLLEAQRRYALANNGAYQIGNGGGNLLTNGDLDVNIPVSRFFNVPIIDNNAANVAQVTRSRLGRQYILFISDTGAIGCTPAGPWTCARLGFP